MKKLFSIALVLVMLLSCAALAEAPITLTYGQTVELPTEVTLKGYDFVGYRYTDENGMARTLTAGEDGKITLTYNKLVNSTLNAIWTAKTYSVTLVKNNGEQNATITVAFDAVPVLPTLTKTGHTFAGWKIGAADGVDFASAKYDATYTTIVATWTPNVYTITYNFKGGEVSEAGDATAIYGQAYVLPTLVKEGYHYVWTLNGVEFVKGATFTYTQNLSLVADWTANTYEVTLVKNNGEEDAKVTATYGQMLALPTNLTKVGYKSYVWRVNAVDGGEYNANAPYAETQAITLYADWTPATYTITYITNGGSELEDQTVTYGEEYELGETNREHYNFGGWKKGSVDFVPEKTYTEIDNLVLTAQWNPIIYEITLIKANGEQNETIEVAFDAVPVLPDVTKTGHTFAGWKKNTVDGDSYVSAKYDVSFTTLVATWTANKYTLTVYGWEEAKVEEVTFGASYAVPSPSYEQNSDEMKALFDAKVGEGKAWATFTGYTIKNDNNEDVPFTAYTGTYNWGKNVTIYPVKTDNTATYDKWIVTFHYGDNSKTVEIAKADAAEGIPAGQYPVAKTGYQIGAWHVGSLEGAAYVAGALESNLDLYATYEPIQYTITLKLTAEGEAVDTVNVCYDAVPVLPTANKDGYTFNYWTVDGDEYVLGAYKWTENKTFVADFSAKTYTITYLTDGGFAITQQNVTYGEVYALGTTTKTGYNFNVWKLNNKDGATFEKEEDEKYARTENLILFATWTPKTYTVTLVKDNGDENAELTATYGQVLEIPSFTKTGYTRTALKINDAMTGDPYNTAAAYEIDEDITLYAVWSANTYTITYVTHGGTSITDQNVTYGAAYTLNTTTRDGYEFNVWKIGSQAGDTFVKNANYDLASDLELHATWTPHVHKITVVKNNGDANAEVDATYDSVPDVVTPERTGYTFTGWKISTESGAAFDATAAYTFDYPITIVATWNARTFTITIDENGGNDVANVTATYGQVPVLPAIVRTGYSLVGWKVEDEAFDATAPFAFTDDITIVALWEVNTYTIHYVNVGEDEDWDSQQVTFGDLYDLKELSKFGYTLVSYTYNNEVVTSTTNIEYTQGSDITYYVTWAVREIEKADNFFTEGEVTVLLTGLTYTPKAGYAVTGGETYYQKTAVDTIKPIAPGEFTMVLTNVNNSEDVINKQVKIAYSLSSIFAGSDYNSMMSTSTANGTFQQANVKEDYVMDVGMNNYKPDLTIKSDAYYNLTMEEANIVYIVKDGENDVTSSVTYADGAFNFGSDLLNKTLTLTMQSKYDLYSTPLSVTMKVNVNDGVNVYTNLDLKAKYADLTVKKINILRNIKAQLVASDYISGYGESYGNVSVFTDPKDIAGSTTLMTNVNLGAPINDFSHGVYTRITSNPNDEIILNGNYFSIDGSSLPYINNSVDKYGAGGSDFTVGAGYRIADVQIGMFLYRIAVVNPANGNTIKAFKNNDGKGATISNLRIEGNNIYDQIALQNLNDGNSNHLLKMSAAYIGIVVRGGTMNMDNVSIRNTAMGFMLAGDVSGYEKPGVVDGDKEGQPQDGEKQATQFFGNHLIIDNSWANSIYAWDLCVVNLKNSKIGQSSGAAIHVDDRPRGGSTRYDGTTPVTPSWLGYSDLQTELVMDIYTAGNINNWVSGQEAWFIAYGKAELALQIQQLVDGGVKSATGNTMTILKQATINGTPTNLMNFAILINEAGNGWSDAERKNDKQGGSSAALQTYSYNGSQLFYGDTTELGAIGSGQAQSRPFTFASTQPLDGTPTGAIKLLLPIYYNAEVAA